MDTENKLAWCASGADAETEFVKKRLIDIGLDGYINPAKESDVYAHDMVMRFQSDLKTVRTPLFKAMDLYGIDPQYAVTFNLKDMRRYKELYPNIIVIFDVNWGALHWTDRTGKTYAVKPMHKTYGGFLSDIRNAVVSCGSHVIKYKRRVDDDQGNAKESFVFDVRKLHLLG